MANGLVILKFNRNDLDNKNGRSFMKYKKNNYMSIYNCWFDTDIVPTVVPTLSFYGMIEFPPDEI